MKAVPPLMVHASCIRHTLSDRSLGLSGKVTVVGSDRIRPTPASGALQQSQSVGLVEVAVTSDTWL